MRNIRLDAVFRHKKVAEMTGEELAQVIAAAVSDIADQERALENIEMMLKELVENSKK